MNLESNPSSRASSLGPTPNTSTQASTITPMTMPALNHANSILRRHTKKFTAEGREEQAYKRISLPPASDAVCVAPMDHQHNHNHLHPAVKGSKRPQSIFQSFPNTPMASRGASEYSFSETEDEGPGPNDQEWGMARGAGRREEDGPETWAGELWRRIKFRSRKVWRVIRRIAKRVGSFVCRHRLLS